MSNNINLPNLSDIDFTKKRVLVRADLDLTNETYRLEALLPTLKYLSERGCKITIIGHRGKPKGKTVMELSLGPVEEKLRKLVPEINFQMLENLRFDLGEESDNLDFAKRLAENEDVYVNEAFAASHREHASIVALPKLLPHAAGLRFCQEVENLSKVLENPKRPLLIIISGVKEDKLTYLEPFLTLADKLLVGGRLPELIGDDSKIRNEKLLVADLNPDKEDITIRSIERFEEEIAEAGTTVLAGPIGKYEEGGHRQGTERVFKAVANSKAFKVAGGGDTISAINLLGISHYFDWISVGGGAMLKFLSRGTLPGIEALLH